MGPLYLLALELGNLQRQLRELGTRTRELDGNIGAAIGAGGRGTRQLVRLADDG